MPGVAVPGPVLAVVGVVLPTLVVPPEAQAVSSKQSASKGKMRFALHIVAHAPLQAECVLLGVGCVAVDATYLFKVFSFIVNPNMGVIGVYVFHVANCTILYQATMLGWLRKSNYRVVIVL